MKSSRRIVISLALIIGSFLLPWFVIIPIGFIGAWMFRRYCELIAVGAIIDVTTGSMEAFAGGYVFTLTTIVAVVLVEFLKTRIRHYG